MQVWVTFLINIYRSSGISGARPIKITTSVLKTERRRDLYSAAGEFHVLPHCCRHALYVG